MRSVSVRLEDLKNMVLCIGYVGENEHTRVTFDAMKMYAQYPHASVSLTVQPPEGDAYPAVIERDGDLVIWEVTDSDLISEGSGELQLAFTDGEKVAKTYIGRFRVHRSIMPTGEIPEPLDDFLTRAGAALTAIPETIDEEFEAITAEAETLAPGSQATASFDGETKVLSIGVPEGEKGDPGQDGYTPRRGVDYWTPADQAAMLQDIATEKADAIAAIENKGTQQVGLVTDEGTTQKAAVQAKGDEVLESIPSDYSTLSSDVSNLKSEIDALLPIDLAKGTAYTAGKYVYYADGTLVNSSGLRSTDYIDITGCTKIRYSRLCMTQSSTSNGIAFYDSGKTFITDSGIKSKTGADAAHYEDSIIDVPANAKYIRLTALSATDVYVYNEEDYNSKVYQRIEKLEESSQEQKEIIDELVTDYEIPEELTLVANQYINGSGEFVSYNNWSRTDYIEVEPGSTVKFVSPASSQYNFSYDANKNPIGSKWTVPSGTSTKVVGSTTKYIALSGKTADMNSLVVYTGNKKTILKPDIPLSETMTEEVDDRISKAVQTDQTLNPTAYLMKQQIPDYYFTRNDIPTDKHDIGYLDDKINSIPDGYHFIFVTDVHWVCNAKQGTKLISYVRDRIGAKIILFGGDILTAHNTDAIAYRSLCDYIFESKNAFGSNFLPVVGNHDLNSSGPDAASHIYYSDLVPVFMQGCDKRFHYCDFYDERIDALGVSKSMTSAAVAALKQYFRTCYYLDDAEGKTRYIIYNTGIGSLDGGSGIQTYISADISGSYEELLIIEWIYSVLMSTPTGYNIVLCSHIPCSAGTSGPVDTPITSVRKSFATMITAFTGKRTAAVYISDSIDNIENWCPRSMSFDFTNAPDVGTVFVMGGHYHVDTFVRFGYSSSMDQSHTSGTQSEVNATALTCLQSSGTVTEGHYRYEVPIIFTQHDAYTRNSMPASHTMTIDTVTEQVFDVVTIKPNGDIALTRIGAGNDRYVAIT